MSLELSSVLMFIQVYSHVEALRTRNACTVSAGETGRSLDKMDKLYQCLSVILVPREPGHVYVSRSSCVRTL